MVVASAVLVVSMLALAFSIGRYFPMPRTTDTNHRPVLTDALEPLEEIKQRQAIEFDRLEVDRGGAELGSEDAMRQAKRGDAE